MQRAIEHLGTDRVREAARHFGAAGLDEVWDEFDLFGTERPFDEDSPFLTLFFAWVPHGLLPNLHDTDVPEGAHGVTAAQAYLNLAGSWLDPIARGYVETCCGTPCSFHEVINCRPGHGMRQREVLLDPKLPELRNTDGEPLETHALVFDLDAREAAVERLADRAAGVAEPEIECDTEGRLGRADITRANLGNRKKDSDNATLGHLRIEGRRLTADVNSAQRAAASRKLVKREPTPKERAQRRQRQREPAEFAARPEVQAAGRKYMCEHSLRRMEEKLHALGNRTPRKAVRGRDGREAVEALINQIDRDGARMTPPLAPGIVREARQTLRLKAV